MILIQHLWNCILFFDYKSVNNKGWVPLEELKGFEPSALLQPMLKDSIEIFQLKVACFINSSEWFINSSDIIPIMGHRGHLKRPMRPVNYIYIYSVIQEHDPNPQVFEPQFGCLKFSSAISRLYAFEEEGRSPKEGQIPKNIEHTKTWLLLDSPTFWHLLTFGRRMKFLACQQYIDFLVEMSRHVLFSLFWECSHMVLWPVFFLLWLFITDGYSEKNRYFWKSYQKIDYFSS